VDRAEGDRTVESVVGREFPLVARFRVGGRPRIPEAYEMRLLTPGPDVRGERHWEFPDDPAEDAEQGEVRFPARPHAPGRTVILQVVLPGREPIRREATPPPGPGGESVVEFDL
jgi:hypothetical protein